MTTQKLKIGTRGSDLALAQAHEVRNRLNKAHTGLEVEIEVISTRGDRVQDRPLSEIGGKGLFTEEIEERLSDGRIDIAVHSTKDMPTLLPDGLELSCYLPREAPCDAFISFKANTLEELPHGAVVGSSSLRRQAMIKRLRPDIKVVLFRGNVQTRLRKLKNSEVDATLLAQAGLNRLGMADVITSILPVEKFLPAPGQGAICIENRADDEVIAPLLAPLNDEATTITLAAERAFLRTLDGSCRTPLAAHATLVGDALNFTGLILSPDGTKLHQTTRSGPAINAAAMGEDAAQQLRDEAGNDFFADWV